MKSLSFPVTSITDVTVPVPGIPENPVKNPDDIADIMAKLADLPSEWWGFITCFIVGLIVYIKLRNSKPLRYLVMGILGTLFFIFVLK